MRRLSAVGIGLLALVILSAGVAEAARAALPSTVEDLLNFGVGPFAIGHRGDGENLGEDPSRPIENTVKAVRRGFMAGVSVVEVDVQLTADGEVAVLHDDLLHDGTCINHMTLSEVQARLPYVPSLQAVLNQARHFNEDGSPPRGLVIVELKAAAPACDPADTQEPAIVSHVTAAVRRMGMADQVLFASLSPALLFLAAEQAPDITRILTVMGLQLLDAETITRIFFPLQVTPIAKRLDLGLQWAEIGPFFRLPGYGSVAELMSTAAVVGAAVVEGDLALLESTGALLVPTLHGLGFKVFGFTANTADEWAFLEALGVDGIYTNDIPLGVRSQPHIP